MLWAELDGADRLDFLKKFLGKAEEESIATPFPPDRTMSYAWDEPILSYYAGIFDIAYIALHPFLHGEKTDSITRAPDADFIEKNSAKATPWEKIRSDLGFKTLARLERAVRISGGALREELGDASETKRLDEYCEANSLWLPEQDTFPPFLEPSLVRLFQDAGIVDVEVREELDETLYQFPINALDGPRPWSEIPGFPTRPDRIMAKDRTLLAIIEWDTTFTVIAGTAERLEQVNLPTLFEGFAVTPNLRMDWWRNEDD